MRLPRSVRGGQRLAGGGQQLEGVVRLGRARGADRHRRPELAALDEHRPGADDLAEGVGDAEQRLVGGDVRCQHGEALAVEARQRVVRAQHGPHPPRDLDQDDVARGRPVLLVQPPEVVDVDQEDPGRGIAALGPVQLRLQQLDHVAAVVGVRERVDLRLALRVGAGGDGLRVGHGDLGESVAQLRGATRDQLLGERQPAGALLGHQGDQDGGQQAGGQADPGQRLERREDQQHEDAENDQRSGVWPQARATGLAQCTIGLVRQRRGRLAIHVPGIGGSPAILEPAPDRAPCNWSVLLSERGRSADEREVSSIVRSVSPRLPTHSGGSGRVVRAAACALDRAATAARTTWSAR